MSNFGERETYKMRNLQHNELKNGAFFLDLDSKNKLRSDYAW